MDTRDLMLAIALAGGVYFLTRRNPATGRSLADDLLAPVYAPYSPLPAGAGAAVLPSGNLAPAGSGTNRTGQLVGAAAGVAGTVIPLVTAGGGAAAAGGGAGAASAGAGIGLTGALAATGIAAGAAILAWGIITKGWLRGGEEGIYVNPARDTYFDYFIAHSSYAGVPTYSDKQAPIPGGVLIHTARLEAYAEVARSIGMPESEIARTRDALVRADTKAEWQAAAEDANATFQRYGGTRVAA